jgi:outer membrane protein OmpA-like peptidoglycan-associated protein
VSIDVRAGMANSAGPAQSSAPPPTPPPIALTGRWGLWTETHLQFPTGVATLPDRYREALVTLAGRMRQFLHDHPQSRLRYSITAHTSRRWAGAGDAATNRELNDRLSQMRAEDALRALRQSLGAIGIPENSPRVEPIVGGAPFGTGTDRAVDRGDASSSDPVDQRAVDIMVEYAEWGIRADMPGALPGAAR